MTGKALVVGLGLVVAGGAASLRLGSVTRNARTKGAGIPGTRGTSVTVSLARDPDRIVVSGLDRALTLSQLRGRDAFTVRVASSGETDPAMAGRYSVGKRDVVFQPAFSLLPGVPYRIQFALARIDTTIVIPVRRSPGVALVDGVYPTADILPMNQLKLYVHFATPMRAGDAAAHVRLIDAKADTGIPNAFFRLDDELWDPTQTRLTILFDPARIKRGLVPNAQLGLPLQAGRRYKLLIDRGWRDANGDSLRSSFEKEFRVSAPDRRAPDVTAWRISAPGIGTLDTLRVTVDEPLDRALLERVLLVRGPDHQVVEGRAVVMRGETRWAFVPSMPWRSGDHLIEIDTAVEDLAGNNLRRLFDADVRDAATASSSLGETISLGWSPRAHPAR